MPDSNAVIRWVNGRDLTAAELHDLLKLRVDVFVVEQDCPYHEIDGRDLAGCTEHLWVSDDDGIAASVRILSDPRGRRIGRVVTRSDRRGEGLAAQLIAAALDRYDQVTTVLDAQSHLQNFYQQFGYQVDGPEFVEDGIPHVPMTRVPLSTDGDTWSASADS